MAPPIKSKAKWVLMLLLAIQINAFLVSWRSMPTRDLNEATERRQEDEMQRENPSKSGSNEAPFNQDPVDIVADNKSAVITPIEGRWVYVGRNRTFAASVCCGWDRRHYLTNPTQCGTERIDDSNYRGYGAEVGMHQQTGGHACECRADFVDEFQWRPSRQRNQPDDEAEQETFIDFDPIDTCRRLGHRTVLFIGDSTFQQTASTLMNALIPGDCAMQIRFQGADTLIDEPLGMGNRGIHWERTVALEEPDLVVLGAGAHIETYANFTRTVDEVLKGMKRLMDRDGEKKLSIVWKTQQPGGCTDEIFHPDDPDQAATAFDFSYPPGYLKYQHNDFYRRDLYALGKMKELGLPYSLDMRMLYSRSDAHIRSGRKEMKEQAFVDCLHLCSPGPLDVIAPMFHRLLGQIDGARTKS